MRSVFVLLGLCILLAGCAGDRTEQAAVNRPVIGVSVLTLTNPFFGVIGNTIKEEAARHGYEVTVVSAEFDVNKQQNQVSDFVVRRVAAIVLTPADSKAIGTAIAEANRAGIPVFTADIAVLAEGVDVVAHIATDNYQAGRLSAQALIEALDGTGKVGIIDFPDVESVILRTRGFMDELEAQRTAKGITLEVVSRLPGGGVKDRGFRAMQDMMEAHPDLRGIFAINDPSALGAVAALEQAGKEGTVRIVSVDGQPEGRQAVKDGKIYADAIQHPDEIGRKTVEAIVQYMTGTAVAPEILIPTDLYLQQDALNDPSLPD